MPDFRYSAVDKEGQAVSGAISAENRRSAISALTAREIFVTGVEESKPGGEGQSGSPWKMLRRRKVSRRMQAGMYQQLTTALQAGLPLLSGLRVVQEQAESEALRSLVSDLGDRVQGGESLSQAMSAHPDDFSPLVISMARVGETSGVLDQVMGHVAEFAERDVDVREKIRSAATYPMLVLIVAAISIVIVLTVILPRVLGAMSESVAVLPLPTRIMMVMGDAVRYYGWLFAILVVGGMWGFRAWRKTPVGHLAFDKFLLRLPVLGTAIRRIAVARFARTLGTLSKSGIPILEALRVLRNTLGNEAMAQQIDRVADSIREGQPIAEPLRETGQFPPLLTQVIAMGERTGKLDELLLRTADSYDKETTAAIQRVMTVLPTVFIMMLAIIAVFVLSGILLPILQMQTSITGM